MLKATINGLQSLRRPEEVAARRGLTISQVLPTRKVDEASEETPAEPAPAPAAATAAPGENEETESGEGQDPASS
jgi:small subunit ribosomal protein S5